MCCNGFGVSGLRPGGPLCWLANLRSGLLGAFEGAKRTLTSVPGQMLLGRLSCLCVWMCVCVGVGKLFLRLNVRWSGLYCLPLGNVSSALRFFGTLVGVRNLFLRSLFATFGMKELLVIRLATVA